MGGAEEVLLSGSGGCRIQVLVKCELAVIPQGVPLRSADIADGLTVNAAFLNGVLESFAADASEFHELNRAEPLVLGDGFIESGKLFLDPVHCTDQMDEEFAFHR